MCLGVYVIFLRWYGFCVFDMIDIFKEVNVISKKCEVFVVMGLVEYGDEIDIIVSVDIFK